jgi:tetratricopeptide (TPR) repeat protein
LAAILHDEGNLDEAFKYRMMCLRLQLARFHSIEKWKIGESYSEIASSYLSENNYIRAHEYYMKALTMQRKSLVPNHPMRAVTHSNLALVLESLGQLDEATHHSRLAVKILERTYGTKEHPRMRAYQLTYNSLFQKLLIERLNGLKQS